MKMNSRLNNSQAHGLDLWFQHGRFYITAVAILTGFAVLAILYGFGPGLLPSAGMQQFFLGLARCYAEHLPALRCDAVGQPAGYTVVFGLPYILPVALLDRFGLPLLYAGRMVELFYLALAFAGCVALIRSFQVRLIIALAISFVFFASPIVFAQDGYGPLRLGFALLPLYGWVDLVMARRISVARNARELLYSSAIALVILVCVRSLALFMDGYSFVMGLVLSAAVLLPLVLRMAYRLELIRLILVGLGFVLSTVIAYLVYSSYVGGTVESTLMPLDFFRGQGVDLYALAVPSSMQWFAQWFGIYHSITGWMSFSDGPNVTHVYLGWSVIGLFLVGLFVFLSRQADTERKIRFGALVLLAHGSLILALGPSLKLADFREGPPPDRFIQFSDYFMPQDQATISLGTASLYQDVPGVRNMRAVYRWMLLVKLSFLLLAALVLEQLTRQPHWRFSPALILVLLVIELLPNVPQRLEHGKRQFTQYQAFEQDALASLRDLNLKGKTVLLLPVDLAAGWNHFTANFLCPMAEIKCFNLGGDKSLVQARLAWPMELRELSRGRWSTGNLQTLLLSEAIDEVLIPLFSLRLAAERWPPSPAIVESNLNAAMAFLNLAGVQATRDGWFLRLSKASLRLGAASQQADFDLAMQIERWGPYEGSFVDGFNVQFDGRSSFWVLFAEGSSPSERMMLSLDGFDLETFHDSTVLSARLPNPEDVQRFPPGSYSLEVRDQLTGQSTYIGDFTVVEPR